MKFMKCSSVLNFLAFEALCSYMVCTYEKKFVFSHRSLQLDRHKCCIKREKGMEGVYRNIAW